MMKKRILRPLLAAALLLSAAACSDEDSTPADPSGTVTLNMMNSDNGKTLLGEGIYIDQAQNFVARGTRYDLFALGRAGSLGAVGVQQFDTPAEEIAAQAGHGYAAVPRGLQMQFPSGAIALEAGAEDAAYLKIYVVSEISKENSTVGAVVRYVTARPADYGLPASGSTALTIPIDSYPSLGTECVLWLPTADFEYDFRQDESTITCEKRGNALVFKLWTWFKQSYTLYLRVRESYVKVRIDVV